MGYWLGGTLADRLGPRRVMTLSFLLCLAASRAGAVPVPVNPQLTRSEFDHVVAAEDAYGGTIRQLNKVFGRHGIKTTFVDTQDPDATAAAMTTNSLIVLSSLTSYRRREIPLTFVLVVLLFVGGTAVAIRNLDKRLLP